LCQRATPTESHIKILAACQVCDAKRDQANTLFHDGFSVEESGALPTPQASLAKNYCDDFELLELPALDLPEPESLDDELDEALLDDEEESDVDAAGLLLPESDLLSEAAAEMSDFPSNLLAESDGLAGLLPDLA
jgi:hypothetical protein